MRFYISKNLGKGFRVGTSVDTKGCGKGVLGILWWICVFPFIIMYYVSIWPFVALGKLIVKAVKNRKDG